MSTFTSVRNHMRLIAGVIVLGLAACFMPQTSSAAIILPPSVPQPQASNDVVGFNLQNTSATALPSRYVTFGQPFVEGKVPNGAILKATVSGSDVPVQMDVKTRYSDGSVRFAVITVKAPALSGNATVGGMLATGGTTGTPVNLASVLSNYNVTVTLSGGVTKTINVGQELQTALSAGTATYWQQGPLATQARVDVPVSTSLHVMVDVTAYADDTFSTDVSFRNDHAMQASGGTKSYTATIAQNGTTVYTSPSLTHYQYQQWHKVINSAGVPTVNVQHDVAYLIKTGVFPNYDLTTGIDSSLIYTGTYVPLGAGDITKYMPMTGDRGDIGPMPGWNTTWLLTQHPTAANFALVQADSAGSIPWHYFDPTTGDYVSLDKYPTLWADPRGNPKLTQFTAEPTWDVDGAHQPDASFLPYVVTGSRIYLDQLNGQATFVELYSWNDYRQDGLGLLVGGDQVRQGAWSLRQIQEAAWANPDGSPTKAYWMKLVNNNYQYLLSKRSTWGAQSGDIAGIILDAYNHGATGYDMSPWQQDYFSSTVAAGVRFGFPGASQVLDWTSNFLVGRFLHAANGFNPRDGIAYAINIAGTPPTWSAIGQATVAAGNSNGTGWNASNGDYGILGLMALAGIYNANGSAQALQAYNWLLSVAPPYTDLRAAQTDLSKFHIVPAGNVAPPTPDTQAPSVPTGLTGTAMSSSQINLTWTASTDDVGVAGYRVYRNSSLITTVNTTAHADSGLNASTAYSYTVSAVDAAGNESAQSGAVSVTTMAPGQSGSESLFGDSVTAPTFSDNAPWELGTQFSSVVDGTVQGIRVYGATGESGAHTARIWNNTTGAVVGGPYTLTFSGPGWYTYTLPTPVAITANTQYTVSVSTGADTGRAYVAAEGTLTTAGSNGLSLRYPANAGVYSSTMGTRPTGTYNSSNYYRDIIFVTGSGAVAKFAFGDRVQTTTNLNVRSTPSTAGTLMGTQSSGALGTVAAGPTSADGFLWWNVNYDSGVDGWSVEDYLIKTTTPPTPTPTATLSANPTSITAGQSSTITWASTDATACTGTGFSTGNAVSGSVSVTPDVTTTYSIACTGTGGTANASATVSVSSSTVTKQVCVGSNCSYATLQSAFSAATNGSTITISGEWTTGAALSANNVTIRGLTGAHLKGGPVQGKAGIVVSGSNTTIENLECSQMNVPDENGACVRLEGPGLTLRNVNFHDNQNGLLTAANVGQILIEGSTFERNGYNGGGGYAHGIYVNGGTTELTIRTSKFLRTKLQGHEVKSRAAKTTIENSTIATLDGADSRDIDIPNGGVVIIRNNVIEHGPASDNSDAIGIGLEGVTHSTNSILIDGNYIILERSGTNVLLNVSGMPAATITGNTLIGGTALGGSNTYYSSRSAAGIPAYPYLPPVGSTTPPPTDTTPPTTPTNLTGTAASQTQINLTWSAATDNVAVTGYRLYRNGTAIMNSNSTSYNDTGLTSDTAYTYLVRAYDAAGNTSASSSPVTVRTQAPSPVPTATLTANPTAITSGQSATLTWSSANANSCTGTGFATGNQTSGSVTVSPTANTTYTLTCTGSGGTVSKTATVTVTQPPTTATENIFGTITPASRGGDNVGWSLGTVFKATTAGTVTGIRLYVATGESGVHTARLWRGSTLIGGPYTFTPTGTGWYTYTLPTPVAITANTNHTVAVTTGTDATKYYAYQENALAAAGGNGAHLTYPANAGKFNTSVNGRPTTVYNSSNYFRDVVFLPN